jgi:hypothetical protein
MPITLRLNRHGHVSKISGEAELRKRQNRLATARIVRAKNSGAPVPRKAGANRKGYDKSQMEFEY